MHILTTTSASLDDLAEPVDLRQTPADIVALSFTDSDLAGLAAAWKADAARLPSMRLAALRDLRHPMSVDLWVDSVARHAKIILVRILGGYDWWRYGCDQLASTARARGIKLALLPGECRDEDLRLIEGSTLPREELDGLLDYFREGGPANMTRAGAAAGAAGWGRMRRSLSRSRAEGGVLSSRDAASSPSPSRGGSGRRPGVGSPRDSAPTQRDVEPGRTDPTRPCGPPSPRGGGKRRPHPLLPLDAAGRRCRADRRAF